MGNKGVIAGENAKWFTLYTRTSILLSVLLIMFGMELTESQKRTSI
jgi:hypothetical protein